MFPLRSTVRPVGPSSRALTASSPSIGGTPLFLPAAVVMIPLVTMRTLLLPKSAMYRFPARSTATSGGSEMPALDRRAAVAAEDAGGAHAGRGGDDAVRAHAAYAPVEGVGDVQVPRRVHRHALGPVQPCAARRSAIAQIAGRARARHGRNRAVRGHLAHHIIAGVRDVQAAGGIHRDAERAVDLRADGRAAVAHVPGCSAACHGGDRSVGGDLAHHRGIPVRHEDVARRIDRDAHREAQLRRERPVRRPRNCRRVRCPRSGSACRRHPL